MSTPSSSAAPAPARRRDERLALGLSAAALAVSLVAAGLALAALRDDGSATVTAGGVGGTSDRPAETATDEPVTDATTDAGLPTDDATDEPTEDTGSGSTVPTLPDPSGTYAPVYEQKRLVVQPGGCARRVDLDQPFVNAREGYEFHYGCNDRIVFSTGSVAEVRGPNTTPGECAEAIRLSPSQTAITPSQELVICVITDGVGSANDAVRPKMARIQIESVLDDQAVAMTVSTWELPY